MKYRELVTELIKERTNIKLYTLEEIEEENVYEYKSPDPPFDFFWCKREDYFELSEVLYDVIDEIERRVKDNAALMSELLNSIFTDESEFVDFLIDQLQDRNNRVDYLIISCYFSNKQIHRLNTAEENMKALGFNDDVIEAYKRAEEKIIKGASDESEE